MSKHKQKDDATDPRVSKEIKYSICDDYGRNKEPNPKDAVMRGDPLFGLKGETQTHTQRTRLKTLVLGGLGNYCQVSSPR
jgi:hypothetical protein